MKSSDLINKIYSQSDFVNKFLSEDGSVQKSSGNYC